MKPFASLLVGLFALVLGRHAAAGEVSVTDGDGLRIGSERIRLWGIDSVELDQQCRRDGAAYPCGARARDTLERLLGRGAPSCERLYEDPYGRRVARCSVAGIDLGAEMVRQGWAVDFERYSKGAYAPQQREAQQARRGLWAGEFVMPWDWRR
jgi:endonuclease YncB( thermonuclease family)